MDYYFHSSLNKVEVWNAMRLVFISHKADEFKDPDACRCIQEEMHDCHGFDVIVSNLRVTDHYTKFKKKL